MSTYHAMQQIKKDLNQFEYEPGFYQWLCNWVDENDYLIADIILENIEPYSDDYDLAICSVEVEFDEEKDQTIVSIVGCCDYHLDYSERTRGTGNDTGVATLTFDEKRKTCLSE